MEKLHPPKIILILIAFLATLNLASQTQLCVIEISGNPHVQLEKDYKTIAKGFVYKPAQSIQLETNEGIKFIDDKGDIYELTAPGSYDFNSIVQHKISNKKANVTKKYFSYLYKKMLNDFEKNSNAGVVYRSDELGFLLEPQNDSKIIKDTVLFVWTNAEHKLVTFKLTDLETNKSFVLKMNASDLFLEVDGNVLKKGKKYSWVIVDNKNQNKPHFFSILNDSEVSDLKKKIKLFKEELVELGFNKDKISNLISDHFNTQY